MFILLGGFLGAGKTTSLLRLATHLQGLGKKVGIITNDQAEGLVDTAVKTAETGYMARRLMKVCVCVCVCMYIYNLTLLSLIHTHRHTHTHTNTDTGGLVLTI